MGNDIQTSLKTWRWASLPLRSALFSALLQVDLHPPPPGTRRDRAGRTDIGCVYYSVCHERCIYVGVNTY